MSLRFGSGWLVIYFLICSRTFIYDIKLRVSYCLRVGRCCHLFRLKNPLSSTGAFLEALAVCTLLWLGGRPTVFWGAKQHVGSVVGLAAINRRGDLKQKRA